MSELRPCPFCGKEPMKTSNHTILCQTCNREVLPEIWNTRPLEDALNEQIRLLKEDGERLAKFLHKYYFDPSLPEEVADMNVYEKNRKEALEVHESLMKQLEVKK
jgi:hypothetical protein